MSSKQSVSIDDYLRDTEAFCESFTAKVVMSKKQDSTPAHKAGRVNPKTGLYWGVEEVGKLSESKGLSITYTPANATEWEKAMKRKMVRESSLQGNRQVGLSIKSVIKKLLSSFERKSRSTARPVLVHNSQTWVPRVAEKASRPMAVQSSSGEVFVAHKVAGEKPDWSHVRVPFWKSAVDAVIITLPILVAETIVLINFVPWGSYRLVNLILGNMLFYFFVLLGDWFFFGNSSILDKKTKDTWVRPVVAEQEQKKEVLNAVVSVPITQSSGRKRLIPNAAPSGWTLETFGETCHRLKANGYTFSQPKTKLSSHRYSQLKEHWITLDFIEKQKGFEDRYQLTAVAIDFIDGFTQN